MHQTSSCRKEIIKCGLTRLILTIQALSRLHQKLLILQEHLHRRARRVRNMFGGIRHRRRLPITTLIKVSQVKWHHQVHKMEEH
jgi:hypothetical protein